MRSTDFPFAVMPQKYAVRRYDQGGVVNALREFGQGASFGTTDEAEAFLRSLAGGEYRDIKKNIEAERNAWAEANRGRAMAANLAGGLVPGLAGAFIPGGQVGTIGALGRVARVLDAPVERALARMSPQMLERLSAKVLPRIALGTADEVATGVVQSAGQAETPSDILPTVVENTPSNVMQALGMRTGTEGLGFAVRRRREKKRAKRG
jgi:hypothetical protein